MKLYLEGHHCQYAVEQMLLTLFPGERPEYPGTRLPSWTAESAAVLALRRSGGWITAAVLLCWKGRRFYGSRRRRIAAASPESDRVRQQLLKLAFYDAGTAALGWEPPWGALTGVRPVKIPARALARGQSPRQAAQRLRSFYRVSERRTMLAMDCAQASLSAQASLRPDEVSLYVGIPFCPTRCAYCSFVSADVGRALSLVEPFVDALCQEIAAVGALLRRLGRRVRTVYFGGGTPTALSADQLDRVMDCLAHAVDLSRCTEYTVEAGRPDTITREKLSVLRRNGTGRISVNPQTMQDSVLAAIGRGHTADDVLRAWDLAQTAGFSCINMDLIAGLPADTVEGFCASLDQILALGPENVTVHTLALKKGSRLMGDGGAPAGFLPSGQAVSDMLDYAWKILHRQGQRPYYLYRQKYMSGSFENVGWCRPGTGSLYNICMMEELHTIFSLGGGGMTKIVDPRTGWIKRLANPKYPQEYLTNFNRVLTEKQRAAELYAAREEAAYVLSVE